MFLQADSARLTKLSSPSHKTFLSKRHLEQHRAVLTALLARDGAAAAKAVRSHYAILRQMIDLVTARPPATSQIPLPMDAAGTKKKKTARSAA